MTARPIALVSMPGGGKSTVGRQLARRLGLGFADSDAVIEQRIGGPIRAFFEREGEAAFRVIEADVIGELLDRPGGVVATGGGAVLTPVTRERLHARAHVVYLHATPEELARRLRHDTKRPLLQVSDPRARLRQLYAERDPLYREVAHFCIETGRPTVPMLVNMILMQLEVTGLVDPAQVPSPVVPPR